MTSVHHPVGSAGSPITVQPPCLTDANPIELPVLNLSAPPLLTLAARLQISSNNITYGINLRRRVRGLWTPLISALMSRPFINRDLFSIGMARHSAGGQSHGRLSSRLSERGRGESGAERRRVTGVNTAGSY